MKTRLLFLLMTSFSMGFVLHWFITRTQVRPVNILGRNVEGPASQDQFIIQIDYDGKRFKPSFVTVKKGNYLAITNTSREKLMWLISDHPDLQTSRGYGEGEKLQLVLLEIGEFKVIDKSNSRVSLSVRVE